MTAMGIRQHIHTLERKELIQASSVIKGVGRPKIAYRLTSTAQSIFPQSYHNLLSDVLATIKETSGNKMLEEIFRYRNRAILAEKKKLMPRGKAVFKLDAMLEMLNEEGYLTEKVIDGENYIMRIYHCPIIEISRDYSQPCKYELELYKKLISKKVRRLSSMAEGADVCDYSIPAS